jgi:hypothetical protein
MALRHRPGASKAPPSPRPARPQPPRP